MQLTTHTHKAIECLPEKRQRVYVAKPEVVDDAEVTCCNPGIVDDADVTCCNPGIVGGAVVGFHVILVH